MAGAFVVLTSKNRAEETYVNVDNVLISIVVHLFRKLRISATQHQDPRIFVGYQLHQKRRDVCVGFEPVERFLIPSTSSCT